MLEKAALFRSIVAGLAGIACFTFFQCFYPCHLFAREQMQLFLFTPGHFLAYLEKPAWLSAYLGDFLSQFFYFPTGGVLVLVAVLLAEWWTAAAVVRRLVPLPQIEVYALFLLVAEWISWCAAPYGFRETLTWFFALLFAWLCLKIRHPRLGMALAFLLVPFLYYLIGAGIYLFAATLCVVHWKNNPRTWFYAIPLLGLVVFVPSLARPFFLLTPGQSWLYPAASLVAWLPAGIWCLTLLLLASIPRVRLYLAWQEQAAIWSASAIMAVAGVYNLADFREESRLAFDRDWQNGDWEKVLARLASPGTSAEGSPTFYAAYALARQGTLPERLFDFYSPAGPLVRQGLRPSLPSDAGWRASLAASDAFRLLGEPDEARRAALQALADTPGHRNVRAVEQLYALSQSASDSLGTGKYRRILDKTWFHPASAQPVRLPWSGANGPALDYLLCHYLLTKDLPSFFRAYERWGTERYETPPRLYAEALLLYLRPAKRVQEKVFKKYGIPAEVRGLYADYLKARRAGVGEPSDFLAAFGRTYWFYYDWE